MLILRLILASVALAFFSLKVSAEDNGSDDQGALLGFAQMLRTAAGGVDFAAEAHLHQRLGPRTLDLHFTAIGLGSKLRLDYSFLELARADPVSGALAERVNINAISLLMDSKTEEFVCIIPALKGYFKTTMSEELKDMVKKSSQNAFKAAGAEVVEGVEFKKAYQRLDNGTQMMVWKQADRADFPALIEMEPKPGAEPMLIRTTALERTAPDPSRFDIPSQFKQYKSFEDLLKAHFKPGRRGR